MANCALICSEKETKMRNAPIQCVDFISLVVHLAIFFTFLHYLLSLITRHNSATITSVDNKKREQIDSHDDTQSSVKIGGARYDDEDSVDKNIRKKERRIKISKQRQRRWQQHQRYHSNIYTHENKNTRFKLIISCWNVLSIIILWH